ncbi:hypothetical protein EV649_4406 [Kribbella sp. VKM Ac-2569]|uniref:hypothetical protein n=1 Tax=Kribbella sp. VKM Ac-2569 TaxID=2512220 RepID=UPI00102CAE12|nr:hypothetical protein [Kribbella sp. VKM Ac-2569]RZT16872.1 hypothetical protein EV649_4406 [Kribbella sp. VKM Ac-2569]
MSQRDDSLTAAGGPNEDQRMTIPWPVRRIDTPAAQSLVPVLSGQEALIVAELLEQIADDPTSDQNAIAQLLIMRIHDRLEIIEDPAGALESQQPGKLISLFTTPSDPHQQT